MIVRLALAFTLLTSPAFAAEPEPVPEPTPQPAPAPEPKLVIAPNERPDCPPRFSLSLGAGAGIPVGASADRVDAGLHAAIDFRWYPEANLALWVQTTLSLLSLVEGLPLETGSGSSLTAFTVVAGLELREVIAPKLELTLGVGLGIGGFGIRSTDDAMGWAIDLSAGARYQVDDSLALRLDFAPVIIIPIDDTQATGGHLAVVLRGEAHF